MSERVAPEVTDSPVPVGASLVADPAPLGLAAFALTTFILSLANANVYPAAAGAAIYTAIAYGGAAQLLAGMWEFRRGNTFGATAFSSFGAFWIAVFFIVVIGKISPADPANATLFGTFFLGWLIFTAYMTVAATRVSGAVFVVFVLLTLTFLFLTIGAFQGSAGWTKTGGWFGVATAAAAWYASFAGVTNETFKRVVLPTGTVIGDTSRA
jgi:succinate-acetate transporter protein